MEERTPGLSPGDRHKLSVGAAAGLAIFVTVSWQGHGNTGFTGVSAIAGAGFWIALFLLRMQIRLVFPEGDPNRELARGALAAVEVLEGDKEFLEALTMRLDEISGRPRGRFVISYCPGQPGARRPPTIH